MHKTNPGGVNTGMEFSRYIPLMAMPAMLILVEIGAVLLSLPMQEAGLAAFEDPSSIANPLIFIGILLIFTAFLLLLIKFKLRRFIGIIIGISIFFTFLYIFGSISYVLTTDPLLGLAGSMIPAILATLLLYLYPEWYVIDTLGLLIAAGAASIFGISLEIIPVIILLIILAVYDAISVYKTKHMIALAEGVVETRSPILFVVPKRRGYSYRTEGVGPLEEGERGAFIMGMGDLIMPAILVVSANVFIGGTRIGPLTLPALGAMIGSVAGLSLLLVYVNRGKPQAGLPPINGGVILGFLAGYALHLLV
ncbi:MAG: presenilin family intramembrane aspartyl protease [Methanolinea sp.]|jgi:presenilin-like A22 family membrane protease|nr:presenilin family intramembrane aspartyl protease [Methanolinea sp.]